MSAEVESEYVISPVHDSLQITQCSDLEEWRKKIRTRVTTLKCHLMATQGLTPDGQLVEPYSPSILLKEKQNGTLCDPNSNEDELDSYIQIAMTRLATRNSQVNPDTALPAIALEDVQFSIDLENCTPLRPGSPNILTDIRLNCNNEKVDEVKTKESSIIESQCCKTINELANECLESQDLSQKSKPMWENSNKFDSIDACISSPYTEGKDYDQIKIEFLKQSKEIEKLSKIRDEVENELQDLTANLFQEAHFMVLGANQRAAAAEKALKEANMQVEVLTAEVSALKTLVITSTPSSPNPHLHPQIISRSAQAIAEAGKIFHRGHKKSPSDFELKYGRDTTPPGSPLKESKLLYDSGGSSNSIQFDSECWEVDPVLHREFVDWRQSPVLTRDDPFMSRVYDEDVDLCLTFPNSTLAHKVQVAIEENALYIEEVNPRQKNNVPKKCVLLDVPRYCKYRFRLGDKDQTWYYISQLARNRIIAVCDFLSYLRYIQLGLVKSSIHDVYWEIVKLRRQMAMARLGL